MRAGRLTLFLSGLLTAIAANPARAAPGCEPAPDAKINPITQTVAEGTWVGSVRTPTRVELNGSPSKGDSYTWTQTAGPTVTLMSPASGKPDKVAFDTPDVPVGGALLQFKLKVTGCDGKFSEVEAIVNVTDVLSNRAPVAVAAASPATVNEGAWFWLDGNGSSDPDGDPLAYRWEQLVGAQYVLVSEAAVVELQAPGISDPNGVTLTYRLTVSDGTLTSVAQQLVNIVWVNEPPIANVACTSPVDEGSDVIMDATGSSDGDDGIKSYVWTQLEGGPTDNLDETALTLPTFSFDAPALTHGHGDTMRFSVTVTDNGGLSTSAECSVTVLDKTPPVLGMTGNTAEATSPQGAPVFFEVTATDAFDGDEPASFIECDRQSGDTFPVGDTTLSCSAHDAAWNTASATFTITVTDTTPPTLTVPADIIAEATGPSGAKVDFTASATDLVDGEVTPVCTPPSGTTFALGTTSVSCTATDAAGNSSDAGTFTVLVRDTTPPALRVDSGDSIVGGPLLYTAYADDLVDGAVEVSCTPASGVTAALSNSVTCQATDEAGNHARQTFTVAASYGWLGVLPPISPSGPSAFKQGSTIPVKFKLAYGVSTAVANLSAEFIAAGTDPQPAVVVATQGADAGTTFRWDVSGQQYIFNLSTKRFVIEGLYELTITLDDGTTHAVYVTVKK